MESLRAFRAPLLGALFSLDCCRNPRQFALDYKLIASSLFVRKNNFVFEKVFVFTFRFFRRTLEAIRISLVLLLTPTYRYSINDHIRKYQSIGAPHTIRASLLNALPGAERISIR
jgi:hypothetical protein